MLSELLLSLLGSLILRGNTHISKNFLRILLLGATLSTKIFHEYGPWSLIIFKYVSTKAFLYTVFGTFSEMFKSDIRLMFFKCYYLFQNIKRTFKCNVPIKR